MQDVSNTPGTLRLSGIAGSLCPLHTPNMPVPGKRGLLLLAILAVALPSQADEIRLKDGKKLYGVIVGYEDNMFKVKTDFGYVLVEKDKIASIIPTTPATPKPEPQPAAKKEPQPAAAKPLVEAAKTDANPDAESKPESATEADSTPSPTAVSAKTPAPPSTSKKDKASAKTAASAAKAQPPPSTNAAPANTPNPNSAATSTTTSTGAATTAAAVPPPAPAKIEAPKEADPPPNREEIQGNQYTNFTYGFRMYKAPSWKLMDDARKELPNAIVAMGTWNESTLMVVGKEKTKDSLEKSAPVVEKRLHEIYENYRLISQRKTTVGGLPAIEYHYRGMADDHDWSGTLSVVSHGADIFTILGMTYADNDLIQIQENVISRAIASLDFTAAKP